MGERKGARQERKGAHICEHAPFLSPVDRGRGGSPSLLGETEWGST
jgi:hypothetical protein